MFVAHLDLGVSCVGGLVSADARLEVDMRTDRIADAPRHQCRACVVQVGPMRAAWGVVAPSRELLVRDAGITQIVRHMARKTVRVENVTPANAVADAIRTRRSALELSLSELAAASGVSATMLSAVERG